MSNNKKLNIVGVTSMSNGSILVTQHGLETSITLVVKDHAKQQEKFILAIAVRFYVDDEVDFDIPEIKINCSKDNYFIDQTGQQYRLNHDFIGMNAEYFVDLILNAESFIAIQEALAAEQEAINHAYY